MQTFSISTFAYASQECALLSIVNTGTSGKFYISEIDVVPNSPIPVGTTGLTSKRYLMRCSAVTGGSDIPVRKANLSNTNLPAQVLIRRRPDAVTLTASSQFRSLLQFPIGYTGLGFRASGNLGGVASRQGTGHIWGVGRDSNMQGIVLAEGQGFTFSTSDGTQPNFPFSMMMIVTLRNTSSNATYYVCTQFGSEEMADSPFAILNGSGSGVTLEITNIEMTEIGSSQTVTAVYPLQENALLRFLRTEGHNGGTAVTPVQPCLDYTIPASLEIKKNFTEDDLRVTYAGSKAGLDALLDNNYPVAAGLPLARKIGTFGMRLGWQGAIGGTSTASFCNALTPGSIGKTWQGFSHTSDQAIVLNAKEGFAIVQSSYTTYAEFYIRATILYEPGVMASPSIGNTGLVRKV